MPKLKTSAPAAIGAGYKLIDRYQLAQPFHTDMADVEAWNAIDFALDRPVSVLLLDGPAAEAGAEAARRAALLNDSRLTKIIDVGTIEQTGTRQPGGTGRHYIVTEPIAGPTLEDLVTELPLDPATTRSIIGELALALDAADQRGLHHVAVRPSAVRVNNGRVMLTGLGLDAELGATPADLGSSEQYDAQALAALAYYSLTGYWPLPLPAGEWRRSDAPALPPAPRTPSGTVVPLRELVPGGDPSLLDLADRAFGDPEGSHLRAPHAVAAALRPWGALAVEPVTHPAVPTGHPVTGGHPLVTAGHSAPGRKSVIPGVGHGEAHLKTGRIPRAGKQFTTVVPDDEPLHIRPVEVLDQVVAGQVPRPVYHAPRPPKPRGVRATPIVLGLGLAALASSGAWAAHNVISPFIDPPVVIHTIEPEPPVYTAAPGYQPDGTPLPPPPAPVEIHPVVAGGEVVDPYGDGERAVNAASVTDGDPSTFWYTYTYATPEFGGLKPGVGFLLTLQQEAPVNSVTLYANGHGGKFEVRNTTADDPAGGQLLGTGEFGSETTVDFGGEVELDSMMIWITGLPQLPDGRYRLELREVTLR